MLEGKVVFRCDSSKEIATGHVMRCLTLADELARRGAEVLFICRPLEGNITGFIRKKGHKVYLIADACKHGKFEQSEDSGWRRYEWQRDAKETKDVLNKIKPVQWLIVDHYALDYRWEVQLRLCVEKIIVIDDLANRKHDCDLLLDQNLYPDMETRYAGLVPPHCQTLLGPEYALLRPEFYKARRELKPSEGRVKRILVFMGGSDPNNQTLKVLEAIKMLDRKELTVDVVVGGSNKNREQIERYCSALANFHFYYQVHSMAELMARADLAIGAGGVTTWERCCLGLPSIVMSLAPNQDGLSKVVASMGASVYLGRASAMSMERLSRELWHVMTDSKLMQSMSVGGKKLVDGYGVERVLKKMGFSNYVITIVSDPDSWINKYIPAFVETLKGQGHQPRWIHDVNEIEEGDFVFYLGCGQLVSADVLSRNRHNLVVHESALPKGKGWSPLTWQILEGKNEIPITLFEAAESIDSGTIYLQDVMHFQGTELVNELRRTQAESSIKLCLEFIDRFPDVVAQGKEQKGQSTFYKRRTPKDSRLDPDKTLRQQFNLLRVADNECYPAFFELGGRTYVIKIECKK